jgi:hypothetical protein
MDERHSIPRLDFRAPGQRVSPGLREQGVGRESGELHQQRRDIIELLAPLELLFGSGGDRWTALRRQHRDGIAKVILTEPGNRGLAQEQIGSTGQRRPAPREVCKEHRGQIPEVHDAQDIALTEVEERIESRLAEVRYAAAEARLAS